MIEWVKGSEGSRIEAVDTGKMNIHPQIGEAVRGDVVNIIPPQQAAAIVTALRGEAMPEPSYVNTCYSLIAPDYGVTVAAVYRLGDNGIVKVEGPAAPARWMPMPLSANRGVLPRGGCRRIGGGAGLARQAGAPGGGLPAGMPVPSCNWRVTQVRVA